MASIQNKGTMKITNDPDSYPFKESVEVNADSMMDFYDTCNGGMAGYCVQKNNLTISLLCISQSFAIIINGNII